MIQYAYHNTKCPTMSLFGLHQNEWTVIRAQLLLVCGPSARARYDQHRLRLLIWPHFLPVLRYPQIEWWPRTETNLPLYVFNAWLFLGPSSKGYIWSELQSALHVFLVSLMVCVCVCVRVWMLLLSPVSVPKRLESLSWQHWLCVWTETRHWKCTVLFCGLTTEIVYVCVRWCSYGACPCMSKFVNECGFVCGKCHVSERNYLWPELQCIA